MPRRQIIPTPCQGPIQEFFVEEKIWLKQYPDGVPQEVDYNSYASITAIFEESCQQHSNLTAFVNMGANLNYGELEEKSRAFASYLQNSLGFSKGDRIAIMMPNLLQYPVVLFGVLRAGLVVVNVNPLYTARELKHQLTDSEARGLVVVENFASTAQEAISGTSVEAVFTTGIGDLLPFPKSLLVNLAVKHVKKMVPAWNIQGSIPLSRALTEGASQAFKKVKIGQNDTALLQYTGGTTGLPKGAELTHGNMVANVMQSAAWVDPWTSEGQEIIITALPLYHIFALTVNRSEEHTSELQSRGH